MIGQGLGVHVGHPRRKAACVGHDLARHGVRDDRQPSRLERRREHDRHAREIRVRRAAAPTLSAVVARGAAVVRPRQDRETRRHDGNLQLVAGFLDQELVRARPRRRQEDAVRFVLQAGLGRVVRSEYADEAVELVVVRLHVVVRDRPVIAEPVDRPPPEVVRPEPQRDAAPVVRAAAEHATTEPPPRPAPHGVRLALDVPATKAPVVGPERFLVPAPSARRRVVVPREHRGVLGRVPHRPALEHHDIRPGFGQHLRGRATAGTRPDDADVVDTGGTDDLEHGGF